MAVARLLAVLLLALAAECARAGFGDAAESAREEGEVTLPAFPRDADLLEFYVSAATANRFFIDAKSLSAGSDGVVRYVLVVTTSGGATNVTFEGIRCGAREYKLHATGRADRAWSMARNPAWRPIENKAMNRHHAALSRDYFCPLGNPIASADEGRDALRRGKHPQAD
ncbi:MAG: CNP1-like family protein [Sulfurisoma sp.]|nr:CNP1-like family protein [Sulfurisoma sp.]